MSTEKRKPNWTLSVNDAPADARPQWRSIGAAWETQTGNLFLKVDDGATLRGTAMLFPYRERPASAFRRGVPYRAPAPPLASQDDYMERQRLARASKAPSPPPDDACPNPEAPAWLDQ